VKPIEVFTIKPFQHGRTMELLDEIKRKATESMGLKKEAVEVNETGDMSDNRG